MKDEQDGHSITGRVMRAADIRAIQADALRHGAEIARNHRHHNHQGGCLTTQHNIVKAIESEAERIEKGCK